MSYLRTIDEIPSEELVRELSRRHHLRVTEKCPYCQKPLMGPSGVRLTRWWEKPQNCSCRFGDVDTYHPPHVLKSLQYGD